MEVIRARKVSADDVMFRRRSSAVKAEIDIRNLRQQLLCTSPKRNKTRGRQYDQNNGSVVLSSRKTLQTPMITIQQPSVDIDGLRCKGGISDLLPSGGITNNNNSDRGSPDRNNSNDIQDIHSSGDLERCSRYDNNSVVGYDKRLLSNSYNSMRKSCCKMASPRRSADNIFAARRRSKALLEMMEISPTRKRNSADSIFQVSHAPWTHHRSSDTSPYGNSNSKDLWVRCGRYELPLTMRDTWYDNSSDSTLQAAAARASLRRNGRRRCSEPMRTPPPCPPSPALQHLTSDELKILNTVIHKQEEFEQEETTRTERLQKELRQLEEKVRQAASNKSLLKQVDLRLCRLCYKTQFADGIGRACYDCHRRVCNRCGTFSKALWDIKKNKLIRGKWRCSLCHKRREILMATGMWYHGDDAQPTLNSSVFQKKMGDSGPDSDWGPSGERVSDSSRCVDYTMVTDSEMSYSPGDMKSCTKRLPRRRLLSSEEFSDMLDDEEELDIDDAQFLLERQKSRQERIKLQKKMGKRRCRKVSVGTSTEEDGIITEEVPSMVELEMCPMHGTKSTGDMPSPPNKERKVSFKDETKNKSGQSSRDIISKSSLQRKQGISGGPFVRSQGRVDSDKSRHSYRNSSFASDPGRKPSVRTIMSSHNSKYSHSGREKIRVASATDLYGKTVKSSDCLLSVEEKDDLRRSSAPSRMGQNPSDKEHKENNMPNKEYGRRHMISAEVHMPRRSISLEEDNYKDRWKEPIKAYSNSRDVLYVRQRSPNTPLRAIPAHLDEQGIRRYSSSSDGRKYSPTVTKRLVSQSSVDSTNDSPKKIDNRLKTSPNKKMRYKPKLSSAMRFASVEDGLSPSPSAEFDKTAEYMAYSGGTIKISSSGYTDSSNKIGYISPAVSSFSSGHVGGTASTSAAGGSYSGASSETVPLFHVPLCHTSTTECEESASSISSSRRIKSAVKPKRPYLEQRTQSYADEVSFEGLPSFLANPITSEDQLKQEHLLPTQTKASFRNASFGNQEKVKLCKNPNDVNCRTNGLGMVVIGGKQGPDGKLGAYVTDIISGGSADMCGICVGDQILEWDGSNLVDATYEEVREVTERSGDTVQLLVMYNRHLQNPTHKPKEDEPSISKKLSAQDSLESVSVTGHYGRRNGGLNGVLPADIWNPKPIKRTLPRTPEELKKLQPTTNGKLELRMWHEYHTETLAVNVIKVKDMALAAENGVKITKFIARVRVLPHEFEFPEYFMECKDSTEPIWTQTVVFRDFYIEKLDERAVEVTIWQEDINCKAGFIGEVVLDLDQCNINNDPVWYDLENHDENNGELIYPQRTNAESGFQLHTPTREGNLSCKSLPSIPSTPAHDKVRQILHKKTLPGKGKFSELRQDSEMSGSAPDLHRISPTDNFPMRSFSQEDKANDIKRESKVEKLRRRVSSVMIKVGARLVDRRSKSLEESQDSLKVQTDDDVARRHSDAQYLDSNDPTKGKELLSPAHDSRKSSKSSISSVPVSNVTSTATSDIDEASLLGQARLAPDGDDITSLLGPAQVPPKPSQEKLVQGDLRLGFMITKGQLEIDIICATGLSKNSFHLSPDTYVKTYLCGNKKRFQKKKTLIIKSNTDPIYKQKIKYSACNVHGRYMQILVKEKCSSFDRNPCLGEVVVKLDNLDLSAHTTGWYKLFKESATEFGSTESL